jgi:hypothetical protein
MRLHFTVFAGRLNAVESDDSNDHRTTDAPRGAIRLIFPLLDRQRIDALRTPSREYR